MLQYLARLMGMGEIERHHPREVRSVFLLLLMTAFLTADTMLLAPNLKPVMEEFDTDAAAVGLVSSGFIFVGAAIALIWGFLADRYSRKRLILITILLGEIPCLLTGYVETYNQLFLVRSLTGLGIGGIMPLVYSMIGDLVPERRRCTAVAWIGLADGFGYLTGMVIAANLPETGISFLGASGWRLPFVVVALPNFILAPIFWYMGAEPARGGGESSLRDVLDRGAEYLHRIRPRDYINILKNKTNLYFFLQSIPGTVGWGVLPYWLITYYAVEKGLSIPAATNISLVMGLGMTAGGFFGGIVGDRIHYWRKAALPIFCGITTFIGFFLFVAMIHYPLPYGARLSELVGLMAVAAFAGFFITVTSANVRAIELNVNPPENRGAMMSLFTLTDSVGRGAGPWVGGIMIGVVGYPWTMNLATFCWIPAGLVFLFLMSRQYPKDAARLADLMKDRADEMRGHCEVDLYEHKVRGPRFDPLES